jgi:aspartyl protease family protein
MTDPDRSSVPRVGITFTRVAISNPRRPDLPSIREVEFLVDTGAYYSVVPASTLERLAVERREREDFMLADGTHQQYDVGEAFFEFAGKGATSKVVFAPEGVTPLIGALTLESVALMVNPVTRELLPMRLFLATLRAA